MAIHYTILFTKGFLIRRYDEKQEKLLNEFIKMDSKLILRDGKYTADTTFYLIPVEEIKCFICGINDELLNDYGISNFFGETDTYRESQLGDYTESLSRAYYNKKMAFSMEFHDIPWSPTDFSHAHEKANLLNLIFGNERSSAQAAILKRFHSKFVPEILEIISISSFGSYRLSIYS